MGKIFITGAEGLIGNAARRALEAHGFSVCGCDLRSPVSSEKFDFRDTEKLRNALADCDGVLHLAAVSRVLWGEMRPDLCRNINVDGARVLMKTIAGMPQKMWLVYASSREIYGTPAKLPCPPNSSPNPENVYAKTKLAGEEMARDLSSCGVCTAIIRFSNVFGAVEDYHDRVVPAFAKAAACGGMLRLRGAGGIFDFTPLEDAADAVVCVVQAMSGGVCDLPPVDIVTGRATSLMELAQMALASGAGDISIEAPSPFYPSRFQGDPRPAKQYLGWSPKKNMEESVARLVGGFRRLNEENYAHTENYSWVSSLL